VTHQNPTPPNVTSQNHTSPFAFLGFLHQDKHGLREQHHTTPQRYITSPHATIQNKTAPLYHVSLKDVTNKLAEPALLYPAANSPIPTELPAIANPELITSVGICHPATQP